MLALGRAGLAPGDRAVTILSTALAGLGGLFLLVAARSFLDSPGFAFDFRCYIGGAERLVAGQNIYLPQNLDGPFRHGAPDVYVYAPPLAVFLAPWTALPAQAAATAWLVGHLVLLALACALLPVSRPIRLTLFGLAAVSSSTLIDTNLGNVSLVVLFLLVVTWRWLDRPAGSIALAVSVALRPTLILLVGWWLLRRQLRAAAWAIGAGVVLIAVTLPFVGLTGYLDFLRVVRNDQVAGVDHNGALESVALLADLAAPWPLLAHLAGASVAVAAMLASLRRDRELSFVVTVAASLFLAPLLWGHYLVVLVIPAAFLASRGRPWALALPLLAWLPEQWIWLAALSGLLLPFLAASPGPLTDREGRLGLEPLEAGARL
jgi:hypothetical protein